MRSTLYLSALHCRIWVIGMITCFMHLIDLGNAVILIMWPDDITGVARFIDACLERVYTSDGPPVGDQASDQP